MEKTFHRRHLPHYTPQGVDYFITYQLAGSLPQGLLKELQLKYRSALNRMRIEFLQSGVEPPDAAEQKSRINKLYFAGYESILDRTDGGPRWLADENVAAIVRNGLHALESEQHYNLWCYTIMPNHVHALFQHPSTARDESSSITLDKTMQLLKGRSAFACNKALGRSGKFWQDESYDHVVRDGEFQRIVMYILNNPVKAGLVKHWSEWPNSYVHPMIKEMLNL